ncbi:MAG: ATP-grasp domain-containing protein [Candidatus Sericytochromatia bacterium]|uniref:ATP-grasp domain-containing protein n=1 Tax=Candidatus Tanganyikabacteria bacterium TaxID=2961651 RepID=A0A938BNC7_9BACT|nr:ATP-grasp domain-containing protein [Candidatus Tanganyikabacteria bacterium]
MFKKVLIANRGEIAVRVMRACRAVGATPVTIHSDADAQAPHAQEAESYLCGPAPVPQSYLNAARILEIAKESGCEAVHPGYGLLSENASFARSVAEAGMAWIGPSPEAIAAMGSKTGARAFMLSAGVPVVPGTVEPLADFTAAVQVAGEIGYPVMLKAVAGGGGIGMQLVEAQGDLEKAFKLCAARAKAYFGNGDLYVEKAIIRPRHVEIQVMADHHGNAIHLNERECSIQRRHQKVVEEAGSPGVTPELRRQMGAVALEAVRKLGYTNAGTLEFLLDAEGRYYFLEMNTRLQVEHPVTELTAGVDLVALQLRVAAGERLELAQEAVGLDGHAIEVRIYAEDPDSGMPAPGTISRVCWPEGVRVDTFVADGTVICPHYDPLIAKLIVHGQDRAAAAAKLADALAQVEIDGLKTNLPLLRRIAAHPDFLAARLSTDFLSRMSAPAASGR